MKHRFENYCKDCQNIENYDKALADNFIGWHCHHRKGEFMPTKKLQALKMYYNRPADELIFLTESEHDSLHKKGENNPMYGKKHSEETKNKISETQKGEKNSFYGKKHSEETKKKISNANKGNTNVKGYHWYNNGKTNIRAKECPPGYEPGMLKK